MEWVAFWLHAALSAAALGAGAPASRWTIPFVLAGFALGSSLLRWWPGNGTAAVIVGLALACTLWRPLPPWQRSALAGIAASFAAVAMASEGLAWPGAAIMAVAIPLAASTCAARQPRFAPAKLLDQALCALLVAVPAVAAWTQLTSGWQSALALNRAGADSPSGTIPSWTLATLAAAAVAGIIRQQWIRR